MYFRLVFVFFLFFYAQQGVASNEYWDCAQVETGEWSCAGRSTQEKPKHLPPLSGQSDLLKLESSITSKEKQPSTYIQPPQTASEQTCATDEQAIGNCRSPTSSFLSVNFNHKQEQIFKILQSKLQYNPWENCTATAKRKPRTVARKKPSKSAPISIDADYSELFDKEITSFFGNVKMTRAGQKISANKANYNATSEIMDAQEQVFYSEYELSAYADSALLNLETDQARLRNVLFIAPSAPIRGSAKVVYRDSKDLSRYTDSTVTSCPLGNQDWAIQAAQLKTNRQTGKISAKHARLTLMGLPVLYTPYVSFPLDDRRLSGLLTPSIGSNDDTGFDITIPYYWNIAPNYDLTVRPRYMEKRGIMLAGNFRYLTDFSKGSVGLEYLPFDTARDKARYSGTLKNDAQLTANITSHLDLNYVSDSEYFDELNSSLDITNQRYLKSQGDFIYQKEGISLISGFRTYQTIDKTSVTRPYQKLPHLSLNLNHSIKEWPIQLAMSNEYVNFYRHNRLSGHRFNIKPSITLPIETSGAFISPKFSLQHTEYSLSNQQPNKPNRIGRTLPIFSADSGLYFEKDLSFGGSNLVHTIEPRLFYLYIPKANQTDIPRFDSALNDWGYHSLFRENRFSGTDRIQDANQITVALKSRLLDAKTGRERLNFSLGEIFYFQDREVTLLGSPETNGFSNVVAELNGQISDSLSFTSGIHWSPDSDRFNRGQATVKYRGQQNQLLNLGYRYRQNNADSEATIIQTDASFRWPIYDHWLGVGRWQYSLKFNSTKESFIGLEKESCCWRFRVIWRRYIDTLSNTSDNKSDEGIFVQLELKGLSSFGDKLDQFLEKNLKGYQRVK